MLVLDNNKRTKILKELDAKKEKDYSFSSGRILGSMCTQPHPIAKEAYLKFLETNLGDPEIFPGTKEIESKLIAFISDLVHAPKTSGGQIVSGGTEGNITAMWIAKQLNRKKEVILSESAHFSFKAGKSVFRVAYSLPFCRLSNQNLVIFCESNIAWEGLAVNACPFSTCNNPWLACLQKSGS